MKQLLILAASLLTLAATAQTKEAEALKSKLTKSDAAIADEKKSASAKTWIDRATIKIDMANVLTKNLVAGVPASTLITDLMAGKPKAIEEVTVSGAAMSKYVYDNFDVYTIGDDGIVQFWEVRQEVLPNAFESAYKDLVKAKELNAKDFSETARGGVVVNNLTLNLYTGASNAYGLSKKSESAKYFELAADSKALIGIVDTMSYFNAGVAYFEDTKYDKALSLFEKVNTMGYMPDGTLEYYISSCQDKMGDKDKALITAEAGFAKYPNNSALMTGLINLYLVSKQNPDKLIELIHQAQKLDDKNASLYLVESDIYTKLGDKEKAYQAIEKALALDPNSFNVLYNYGMMLVLDSDGLAKEAQGLPLNDKEGFDKLEAEIIELRIGAIGKFEKALEIQAGNKDLIELLSQLTFLLRDKSSEMSALHDKYKALLTAQ